LQVYILTMKDLLREIIDKYRFLFKDLHGNDFFLKEDLLERFERLFAQTYSDRELVEMVSGNLPLGKSGFVEEFVADVSKVQSLVEAQHAHIANLQDKDLLVPGIKDKKRYEISLMANVLNKMAKDLNVTTLVDFGGGLGHLAKRLTELGYRVIIIDGNKELCNKAKDYVECICEFICKEKLNLLANALSEKLGGLKCIFYSLHACGSLSDCMIELFCDFKNAIGMVNVGCCYNLISYSVCSKSDWSDNEKMAACQCPARWTFESLASTFWRNFHRSVIQKMAFPQLKAQNIHFSKLAIKNPSDFMEYVSLLKREFDIDLDVEKYNSHFLPHRTTFCTWWTLRALYGQLVEYSIVQERSNYINQTGVADAHIEILFDPIQSPRKFGIIAKKISPVDYNRKVGDEKTNLLFKKRTEEETETQGSLGET
jgi:hypothetical protein